MKLYALRDRLMDYFMTPFAAYEDKQVMANLADTINTDGGKSGIQQAPHHFELWSLAEVDEQGHINPKREFLADCGALVRPRRESAGPRTGEVRRPLADRKIPPGGSGDDGRPQSQPLPETAPDASGAATPAHRDGEGGYEGGRGGGEVGGYPFAREVKPN